MYNEDIKKAFFEHCKSTNQSFLSISFFESIEHIEKSLNKDFSEMEIEDKIRCLENFENINSYKILRRYRELLSYYIMWIKNNTDLKCVNFDLADIRKISLISNMKNSLFKDEDDLINTIRTFAGNKINKYVIHVLLFLGVSSEEIIELKVKNVNLTDGCINIGAQKYFLYPNIINFFINYDSFENMKNNKRTDDDLLVHSFAPYIPYKKLELHSMDVFISRMSKRYSKKYQNPT